MKARLLIIALSLLQLTALAIPAKRGVWKDITLSDGSKLRVELRGDEYCSFWQAEDGRCFVKNVDTQRYELTSREALAARAEATRTAMLGLDAEPAKAPARVAIGGTHPDFVGKKKGLIILAEFTDKKFLPGHDAEYYSGIANGLTDKHRADGFVGSIHDYFYDQSEGQFDLSFDVVGPIQLKNNMAYYGGPSQYGHDKNAAAMIYEAVKGAEQIKPSFADYDWFGDGCVDQVFVVYAGRGEASGGDENTIWPHRSNFGGGYTIGGKRVQVYACTNELRDDSHIDGIGAFCHEFSHCLGLPDLYDTQYGGNYGMGFWDIMNSGCYLQNSFRPCAYSGYERNYCGWKQPKVLTDDCEVSGLKGISEGGDYYIIYNDGNKDEYYVLENRSQKGWDAGQFGAGLLVTHIDFNKTLWNSNRVNVVDNNNDHERYAIITADNNTKESSQAGIAGDLYPYHMNTWLTNRSVPASTLYNPNSDGTLFMSKPVTKITRASDGTISFSFRNEVGLEPDPLPEGVIFRETFDDCYGEGGNDGKWTSSTAEVIIPDNDGWTSTYMYGASKCARFGTNTQRGLVTTPKIAIDGEVVLTFKAAPYGTNEATSVVLSVASGNATLSQSSFALTKGQWTDHKVVITGKGNIKIQIRSNKARFFLDEVNVTTLDYDAISPTTATSADSPAYNLMGQPVSTAYRGIVVKGGKKTVVR